MSTDTTLPTEMRAVVTHGVRDYRQSVLPVPTPGPCELLLKVGRCGLCAGDAKCYSGADMFWGTGPDYDTPYVDTPCVCGHEFVGTVAALGAGAAERHNVALGDLVTAEQVVACGTCLYCRRGMRWLCKPHLIYGFKAALSGGCAEYMLLAAHGIVHKIPSSVPVGEAVYVEPLSCSAHGVEIAGIELGDTVVASGCGAIGLGFVALAARRSPQRLIALDTIDSRLELARACGADVCINVAKDPGAVQRIRDMTDHREGCDVYFEASGNTASVATGLKACRKAGRFVSFSVFTEPATVDWTVIGDTKSLEIRGGHCSGDRGYSVAVDTLAKGFMPVSDIVNHSLPLDEIVAGFDMVTNPRDSVKVSVDPTIDR